MVDYDVESDVALLWGLQSFYLLEAADPGSLFAELSPAVALRKHCRDCALTPERADCVRQSVRRGPRPRCRRRHNNRTKRAAGSRNDGSGGGSDPGGPSAPLAAEPDQKFQTPNAAAAAAGGVRP